MDTVTNITAFLGKGTAGTILTGVVLIIAMIAVIWLNNWIKNKRIEQARQKEAELRVEEGQKQVEDNEKETKEVVDDSKKVDEFLK